MTPDERQQSLINARRACEWLEYQVSSDFFKFMRQADIECLLAEFKRLDDKEQAQIAAGRKGKKYGKLGGRPKKNGGKK